MLYHSMSAILQQTVINGNLRNTKYIEKNLRNIMYYNLNSTITPFPWQLWILLDRAELDRTIHKELNDTKFHIINFDHV